MEAGQKSIRLGASVGLQRLREEEMSYVHFIERGRVLSPLDKEI